MYIAIRPETLGEEAIFSVPPVRGKTTHFLYYARQRIISHHVSKIEGNFAGQFDRYKVNAILRNGTTQVLLPDSHFLDIDATAGTSHFTQRKIPNANPTIDIEFNEMTAIEMDENFIVVSCTSCNKNKGKIIIYDDNFVRKFVLAGKSTKNLIG